MNVYTLSNGLTLSVQQEQSVPLVTLDMWVGVGSGDEPEDLAGISHFLEHMLFKGTERLPPGEYDRRIEEVGGYLNAATSLDYTHYYITLPSAQFTRALEDFSDVLVNSSIEPTEVESERQVILEEIARKSDNPFGFLFDEAYPALFHSGPYRHPVIGSAETVRAISRDQLYDHYRRFYTADNMYLSVVGDVDPETVRLAVEGAFANLPAKRRAYRDGPVPTEFVRGDSRFYPRDWNEAYFIVAFPGPAAGTDMRLMALADFSETLLTGGRSSRLRNSLVEKKGLVSTIGSYAMANRSEAPVLIYGTCTAQDLPEVREQIFLEIQRLVDKGIASDEWRRVQRLVLNSHLFALETNAGRASTIGYSQVHLGNARLLSDYERLIGEIRPRDVLEFIGTHLREEDASFFVTARENAAMMN